MSVVLSLDPSSSSFIPFPCLGLVQRAHHHLSPSSFHIFSHSFFVCSVKDRWRRGVSVPLSNRRARKQDEGTKTKKKRPWCGDIGTF